MNLYTTLIALNLFPTLLEGFRLPRFGALHFNNGHGKGFNGPKRCTRSFSRVSRLSHNKLANARVNEKEVFSIGQQSSTAKPAHKLHLFRSWYHLWAEVLFHDRDLLHKPSTRYAFLVSDSLSLKSTTFATLYSSEDSTFILELNRESSNESYRIGMNINSTNYIYLSETHLLLNEVEDMINEGFLIPVVNSYDNILSHGTTNRFTVHLPKFLRHLTEVSFFSNTDLLSMQHSGLLDNTLLHDSGIAALNILGLLSSRSMKYYDNELNVTFEESKKNKEAQINPERGRNIIYPVTRLLDPSTIDAIRKLLHKIKREGLLSTNLDSVDSLPSLHLNLISNGRVLFQDAREEEPNQKDDVFQETINSMNSLLRPFLYEQLLPIARNVLKNPTLQISDVFIRNYGINVQPSSTNDMDDNHSRIKSTQNGDSRLKLSAHYDILSSATCVIALDNVAENGDRGLYTMNTHSCFLKNLSSQDSNSQSHDQVSSHFALRRFFPLSEGDGVIHSWDILHGVHIDESVQRSSLIVWFTESEPIMSLNHGGDPWPWLENLNQTDDVGNLVLALAKESLISTPSHTIDKNILQLFKQSASHGNSFALARLGSFCDEEKLSDDVSQKSDIYVILQRLRSSETKATYTGYHNPFLQSIDSEDRQLSWSALARAIWFESAMRGNKLAQIQLAEACMIDYFSISEQSSSSLFSSNTNLGYDNIEPSPYSRECILRMASTLFVLAFQQDGEDVKPLLTRLAKIEFSRFIDDYNLDDESFDQELFFSRPVMKILRCSILD